MTTFEDLRTNKNIFGDFQSVRDSDSFKEMRLELYELCYEMNELRIMMERRLMKFKQFSFDSIGGTQEGWKLQEKAQENYKLLKNITSPIIIASDNIATFTGTISSILPNNNNNNEIEDFTYEEEDTEEDFIDEDYLTSEDYEFAETIINSTSSGTYLHLSCCASINNLLLPAPVLSSVDNSVGLPCYFTAIAQSISSLKQFSHFNELLILQNYNINNYIYIFNRYRIFIWDPGII